MAVMLLKGAKPSFTRSLERAHRVIGSQRAQLPRALEVSFRKGSSEPASVSELMRRGALEIRITRRWRCRLTEIPIIPDVYSELKLRHLVACKALVGSAEGLHHIVVVYCVLLVTKVRARRIRWIARNLTNLIKVLSGRQAIPSISTVSNPSAETTACWDADCEGSLHRSVKPCLVIVVSCRMTEARGRLKGYDQAKRATDRYCLPSSHGDPSPPSA